jgi:hypothetical protein
MNIVVHVVYFYNLIEPIYICAKSRDYPILYVCSVANSRDFNYYICANSSGDYIKLYLLKF